jgi:photosystem II stability/assembly factor-like uncharacterized protein
MMEEKMKRYLAVLFALLIMIPPAIIAQEKAEEKGKLNAGTFAGLKLRNIGPALMSGRVSDIAVDPTDRSTWYVAVASGGVWKTANAGITWAPIFDNYGSYSIGCVTVDPNNHLTVWVGTGENNSQRSVGWGDGVYKSLDGGRSFKNMGLKNSEHIAKIIVDPRDSKVVYVASQGPLWSAGGDRGLYKTVDGGETWELVLDISENTGVTDIALDPRNPDVVYAAAYQRRRHVWTLINGGPESAVYKSFDAGKTWKKIIKGLPSGDLGRIGLAISPQQPEIVYAIVEADPDAEGFFRSTDGGENWAKMSGYVSGSPQYYNEITADPHQFDRIYSVDVFMMVSDDGGKNFYRLGEEWKHVDNHAIAFFDDDPDHYLIGCDGGLYETYDRGVNYHFFGNLPVTQFYRVEIDNAEPFYNVLGGTQDNNSQSGPSRTNNEHGIRNSDWIITCGGDGYQTRVDPTDPNIIYAESQYGGLVRFDKRSGESVDIQPQTEPGDDPARWNWDTPVMISPHSSTRIYIAAQRLYRSDDRGDTWTPVSPDLTRRLDRNKLEVMGTVWSVDSIAKNNSTSLYGNIVALDESPLVEGLIYCGTDDGLIEVTEDGGANWRKIEKFPGIAELAYVTDVIASGFEPDTVYATFTNFKAGDFKPYVLKSTDRGKSWKSITSDVPENNATWCILEDNVKKDLLYLGTEFGLFFSIDGGGKWIQLKGGAPVIAFRDLEIQKREGDLACATFGRGFYILDDLTPLRQASEDVLKQEALIFPVKTSWMYIEASPLGGGEKSFQGADLYTAPNPPYGTVITYYLRDALKTLKDARREDEAKLRKEGKAVNYPTWDSLKQEDREEQPSLIFTITDEDGNVVRRITQPARPGINRFAWDHRYPSPAGGGRRYGATGPMTVPGKYKVAMAKYVDGELTQLVEPVEFEIEPLGLATLPAEDKAALLAFHKKVGSLLRAVMGAYAVINDVEGRFDAIKTAILNTPGADPALAKTTRELELRLMDIKEKFTGDPTKPRRSEAGEPGFMRRLQEAVYGGINSTSKPTTTHERNYEIAADQFTAVLGDLKQLVEVDLKALEDALEAAGAPYTPGRAIPNWTK